MVKARVCGRGEKDADEVSFFVLDVVVSEESFLLCFNLNQISLNLGIVNTSY